MPAMSESADLPLAVSVTAAASVTRFPAAVAEQISYEIPASEGRQRAAAAAVAADRPISGGAPSATRPVPGTPFLADWQQRVSPEGSVCSGSMARPSLGRPSLSSQASAEVRPTVARSFRDYTLSCTPLHWQD